MKRQQYVEHKDRFGNLIEVGDTILRPLWAHLHEEKVVKMTEKGIYIESHKLSFNKLTQKFEKIPNTVRIDVLIYQPSKNFINLTKLKI